MPAVILVSRSVVITCSSTASFGFFLVKSAAIRFISGSRVPFQMCQIDSVRPPAAGVGPLGAGAAEEAVALAVLTTLLVVAAALVVAVAASVGAAVDVLATLAVADAEAAVVAADVVAVSAAVPPQAASKAVPANSVPSTPS
jgi:hypothetical protein